MRLSRFFITRPIFAAVIAIDHHARRRDRLFRPAGLAISRHRPADRDGHRHLSGRVGRDGGGDRRRADRAGDQRRRRHALPCRRNRPATASSTITVTFKHRHRPRCRAGAGPEPRRDRRAAPARGSAAARRRHPQDLARLPDGREPGLARRQRSIAAIISNYALTQVRDRLARIDGVGDVQLFGIARLSRCGSGSIPAAPPRST